MKEPTLPDKVVAIDRALQGSDVPHAFGGAIALAYYAEPRATVDVDVNVFVGTDRVGAVRAALVPLGITVGDKANTERDGQARWLWGRTPVDLFFSYDPVHEAMRDAVRKVPFGDDQIPVLGPEHLVVCKVVFDRDKDWLDIAQVLTAVPDFDAGEVRHWLNRLLAADDERCRHFRDLSGQILGQ